MELQKEIDLLVKEWDRPDGFFGQLREGHLDKAGIERVADILDSIRLNDNVPINKRIISLIWYIPLFMEWQKERVEESGEDMREFEEAINRLQSIVEDILGVP